MIIFEALFILGLTWVDCIDIFINFVKKSLMVEIRSRIEALKGVKTLLLLVFDLPTRF